MPKKHLTDAAIARCKLPKEGSAEIFDLGFPGLALRVGYGGSKSFELFYRVGGKLKRESLGRWPGVSLADARDQWRATRVAIAKGEAPQREGAKHGPLFEHVVEEWLRRDQAGNKASSLYQVSRAVEADLLPAWRGRPVDQISKRDVIALLDGISDRSPSMARRVQANIFRFFGWCTERDILTVNPTASIPRIDAVKSRDRVLTDDELRKIWLATDSTDPYHAACRLLLLTGLRREEVGQLRWSEIDGDTIKLDGSRTKNGQPHTVHLSAPARALLDGMPRFAGRDYVFTASGKCSLQSWSQAKARLDKECGVTNWRYHDLRRSVSTGLNEKGVEPNIVEAVLGHTVQGVAGVYNRAKHEAAKRDALNMWAAHVSSL